MKGPDRAIISDRLRDFIDGYCNGQVDEAELLEFEAGLLASEAALGLYFAEY